MNLNQLSAELRALAEAKGFRENIADPTGVAAVAVYVANFHGEASELWEAARAGTLREPCDKADKMRAYGIEPLTCVAEEVADMVIRVFDIGSVFEVDIDAAFDSDMVDRFVAELDLSTGTTIHDVASFVSAYHGVASQIYSDAVARLSCSRMPLRVGMMLRIAMHIGETFDVDVQKAVMAKHEFNKTRPFRHGGKLA